MDEIIYGVSHKSKHLRSKKVQQFIRVTHIPLRSRHTQHNTGNVFNIGSRDYSYVGTVV
jgi:hypothetical protein